MVKYRFVKLFEIINDVNDKLSSLDHKINEYFEFPNVEFHPFSYTLEAKIFLPNSIEIKEIRVKFSILYEDCKLRNIFLGEESLKVDELEAVNKSYPEVIEEIKDFSLKKAFSKNCRYRYDSIDSI